MEDSDSQNHQSQPLLEEKNYNQVAYRSEYRSSSRLTYSLYTTILLLCISIAGNLVLLVTRESAISSSKRSKYSGLEADQPIPFEWSTEYADPNFNDSGPLWDAISFDVGLIALPYEWTQRKELIRAQVFPWDHDQGLYVLNGFHALHCLKNIHRAIREYESNTAQSLPLTHITHCLDSLRTDVLCAADDTPRYTTTSRSPQSAVGQIRQCRSWAALEKWAQERTSCYRYISHEADSINQFERFKYCPKDSPYWPALRKHWHKQDDWFGEGCTNGPLGVEC